MGSSLDTTKTASSGFSIILSSFSSFDIFSYYYTTITVGEFVNDLLLIHHHHLLGFVVIIEATILSTCVYLPFHLAIWLLFLVFSVGREGGSDWY